MDQRRLDTQNAHRDGDWGPATGYELLGRSRVPGSFNRMYVTFASRAGDITVFSGYDDSFCLAWRDLRVRLNTLPSGDEKWTMQVTIRYAKGYKYVLSRIVEPVGWVGNTDVMRLLVSQVKMYFSCHGRVNGVFQRGMMVHGIECGMCAKTVCSHCLTLQASHFALTT